jgi:ubiquitin C-terminal hydrolase
MLRDAASSGHKVTLPMENHGNTCFFNATMQCLTHTVPFYNYSLSDFHQKQCKAKAQNRFCYQCEYSRFIKTIHEKKQTTPLSIVRSLTAIWHGYRVG